jgi:cellulose synthase/poly-beta-1,6-N-acetylglucosamine synthase-like glycosyltransferase
MISFVIPALNEELLIARCIHSIRRETISLGLENEIIVVDNGSTDNTAKIAYQAPRNRSSAFGDFKVITEPRRGLLRAKQTGLAAARYPLVAFIDADCMLRLGWTQHVIERFADPRVVAVSGPYHYYDLPWQGRVASDLVFGVYGVLGNVMPILLGGNSVFRADALRQIGGFDTSIKFWSEDTYTAVRCAEHGKVIFDQKLKVDSSGRRLIGDGYLRTLASYIYSSLVFRLTGRAVNWGHVDHR